MHLGLCSWGLVEAPIGVEKAVRLFTADPRRDMRRVSRSLGSATEAEFGFNKIGLNLRVYFVWHLMGDFKGFSELRSVLPR